MSALRTTFERRAGHDARSDVCKTLRDPSLRLEIGSERRGRIGETTTVKSVHLGRAPCRSLLSRSDVGSESSRRSDRAVWFGFIVGAFEWRRMLHRNDLDVILVGHSDRDR